MSWNKTFSHGVALSIDYGVSLLWFWRERLPMTISSHCWLALKTGNKKAVLYWLGRLLEWISPGHTQGARDNDVQACQNVVKLLN